MSTRPSGRAVACGRLFRSKKLISVGRHLWQTRRHRNYFCPHATARLLGRVDMSSLQSSPRNYRSVPPQKYLRNSSFSFLMLAFLKRISFLTPSMVYISVIKTQITIFHMLDLCGQLPCAKSTPAFQILDLIKFILKSVNAH